MKKRIRKSLKNCVTKYIFFLALFATTLNCSQSASLVPKNENLSPNLKTNSELSLLSDASPIVFLKSSTSGDCTGSVISKTHILTAKHCFTEDLILSCKSLRVEFSQFLSTEKTFQFINKSANCVSIRTDSQLDIAVVEYSSDLLSYFGEFVTFSDNVGPDERLESVYPIDKKLIVTSGYRLQLQDDSIVSNLTNRPGMSGSPIFPTGTDYSKKYVSAGMHTKSNSQGFSIAIPADKIQTSLSELLRAGGTK